MVLQQFRVVVKTRSLSEMTSACLRTAALVCGGSTITIPVNHTVDRRQRSLNDYTQLHQRSIDS